VVKLRALEGCPSPPLRCIASAALPRPCSTVAAKYVLALKKNHSALLAEAARTIDTAAERDERAQEPAASHRRTERRQAVVGADRRLAKAHSFPGIQAVARVESVRRVDGKEAALLRYFGLSCWLWAAQLLDVVRTHWSSEHQLHWVLDVVCDEDGAPNRKGQGPENLAVLRKLALHILRSHPDQASLPRKVKRAGWDNAFLLSLLGHMR
jgi:predicted transposase YbfD/YdcC